MRALKTAKNIVLTLALAFVMTLACSVAAKAAPVVPGQVTDVKQTDANDGAIWLEWTAQLTNGVNYAVEVSTDKMTWVEKEDGTTVNRAYIYGLNAGSTYYVRVRAYTREYNRDTYEYDYAYGLYSKEVEVVTAPNSEPSKIEQTNATTTSVTAKWTAVPGANLYEVTYGSKSVYATGTTATINGVPKNSTGNITVWPLRKAASTGYVAKKNSNYKYVYGRVTPTKVKGVEVPYYWQSSGEIKVECTKLASASNYQAEVWTSYLKKDKKIKSAYCDFSTITSTYLKSTKLKKHNFVKVRMRAYSKMTNGTKKYGEWSDWVYVCPEPTVTAMVSTNSGMKIKYDKITGADRYCIYMSTKQKSGYKKVATTTKTSYTVKKFNKKSLKRGKTYYCYVVAYNKVGKKYKSGAAGDATTCWYKKY